MLNAPDGVHALSTTAVFLVHAFAVFVYVPWKYVSIPCWYNAHLVQQQYQIGGARNSILEVYHTTE